jgi:hypothetical protein
MGVASLTLGCFYRKTFVGDFQHLDRYLARLIIKRRPFPFTGPALSKIPAQDWVSLFIEKCDGTARRRGLAFNY